jgi:hypothetical protein
MKHGLLFLFSFLFILNLYATDIQLDAVQQNVVQRAPYLQDLIQAYNARLAVDEQPELALYELTALMYRIYPQFDPDAYRTDLLIKYNNSIDEKNVIEKSLK